MASYSIPCPKVSHLLAASSQSIQKRHHHVASFPRADSRSIPVLMAVAQSQGNGWGRADGFKVHAQLNEVAVEKISNGSPALDGQDSEKDYQIPDEASISAFMDQVSDLVMLVDSNDIAELKLKQMGCELLIRKKEALPQPAPVYYSAPPAQQVMPMPPAGVPAPAPAVLASAPSSPALALPAPAKQKSSHPPFKCPMAGNFYRAPAPGAPPFVQVGDKVQKGQVLCIIEAMKLMNEIEAPEAGTITEILIEDGKPVSLHTPIFIIEP